MSQLGEGFYTTLDLETAQFFAKNATYGTGGSPTILKVIIEKQGLTGVEIPSQLW